jgi:hypothetical protein
VSLWIVSNIPRLLLLLGLVVVIAGGAVLIQLFVRRRFPQLTLRDHYGVENPRIHYPMVTTVGMLVAVNLFLVLELSHPYVGEMATSPEPLRQAVNVLTAPPHEWMRLHDSY